MSSQCIDWWDKHGNIAASQKVKNIGRCSSPPNTMQHLIWQKHLSWSRFQRLIIYIPTHHHEGRAVRVENVRWLQSYSLYVSLWLVVNPSEDTNLIQSSANLFTDNTRWHNWANSLFKMFKSPNAKCSKWKCQVAGLGKYNLISVSNEATCKM